MYKPLSFLAGLAMLAAACGNPVTPQDRLTVNDKKINEIIAQMTLEEKVEMLHSKTNMSSAGVERLGIADMHYADGPFGIREEGVPNGFTPAGWKLDSATYFPTGSALAATWSKDLAYLYGTGMGKEARLRGKDVILGPAVNIQRLPVGGRTYEYLSEDPILSAALSEAVGLEGIFGAFLAGLILNRYIPRLSSLMNRIEFTGNAIFIPYFLIGVGMLINLRLLFHGGAIVWIAAAMVAVGMIGKALAAYAACIGFKMPLSSGHMMFGLTSAHAAGGIAMVMVGMRLEVSPGHPMVDDDMLNGVIIMILFTCIISTLVTERSARQLVIADKAQDIKQAETDDEKILLPVKYPDVAKGLVSMAIMMRNAKLNRGLVALNVVYDDKHRSANQKEGRALLDNLVKVASAADVKMQTQVRVAANIANGIKYAFKEFDASEIIMGMHIHKDISPKFWGEFAQSLYNGLNRQIIFVRLKQPLNTLRSIQVAVPSRAEFEPGFYRWVERLGRLAGNLECRMVFHGRNEQMELIRNYLRHKHPSVRADYQLMMHWNELPRLAATINDDHLFVVVTSRKGGLSYKTALERLPDEIEKHFSGRSLMLIYPDQYGEREAMTFAESQHQEELSAYQELRGWLHRTFHRTKHSQST